MNKLKFYSVIILIVLIGIFLGYFIYKSIPYNFTVNSQYMINLLKTELSSIENQLLNNKDLTQNDKISFINREKQIKNTLNQFYNYK